MHPSKIGFSRLTFTLKKNVVYRPKTACYLL